MRSHGGAQDNDVVLDQMSRPGGCAGAAGVADEVQRPFMTSVRVGRPMAFHASTSYHLSEPRVTSGSQGKETAGCPRSMPTN